MADVIVNIADQTGGISQKGFGLPLVFDPRTNVSYTEVKNTSEIPSSLGVVAKDMVTKLLSQNPAPEKVAVYGLVLAEATSTKGPKKPLVEALNQMLVNNNDFYFLLLASRNEAEVIEVGKWATANKKLFITQNPISNTVDANVNLAKSIVSSRVGLFAHKGNKSKDSLGKEIVVDPYLDAAIVGRIAPLQPGAATWKFKELNGIQVGGYLNANITKLHEANVNTYIKEMGQLQTSEGKATDSSFLDIQRAKDWLRARIQENIFQLLHNTDKIPYDDNGIAQIVNRLKSVLKTAVNRGVIAKDKDGNGMWTIDAPLRADIDVNTISNRLLPDIKFTAVVAGAIHNVRVDGVLTTDEKELR